MKRQQEKSEKFIKIIKRLYPLQMGVEPSTEGYFFFEMAYLMYKHFMSICLSILKKRQKTSESIEK